MKNKEDIKEEVLKEEENKEVTEEQKRSIKVRDFLLISKDKKTEIANVLAA